MFSPTQLIQSLVQRAPVPIQKPVELTPGQVFQGTVIKQYPDNMVLVQIGGMQVQAKMEAKLEPGQKAWLQVQPSTDLVTLKVVSTPAEGAGKEASLEGLIRSLGLPQTKESRAIVQALANANLPVNRDIVQAFSGVAGRLGMDDATIEAFLMAAKRNLPLTPDTVAGLKAFLSEKPVSLVIQNFLQQADLFLEAGDERQAGPSARGGLGAQSTGGDMRQLVSQLKDKVAGLPVLVTGIGAPNQEPSFMQSSGNKLSSPVPIGQPTSQQGTGTITGEKAPLASRLLADEQNMAAKTSQASVGAGLEAKQGGDIQQMAGIRLGQTEGQPNMATVKQDSNNMSLPNQASEGRGNQTAPQVLGSDINLKPAEPLLQNQSGRMLNERPADTAPLDVAQKALFTAQPGVQPGSPGSPGSVSTHPIMELFRQMGIAHERDLMGQTLSGGSIDTGTQKQMETVKSMLLQITQAPAQTLPTGLREAADQLLQQVTGQQLMMVQPSSQALSQIVMQIPIRSAQGDETAYVQIESKKKSGGQVDPENCRLFFHLDLQTMGTTMIDVSIVNRIVNLQIFNDAPWVETLVQGMKEGFSEQLQEAGYHLSSMRVQAIPEQKSKASGSTGSKGALLSDYKGVDLRV
jgi:hypothetical protein